MYKLFLIYKPCLMGCVSKHLNVVFLIAIPEVIVTVINKYLSQKT